MAAWREERAEHDRERPRRREQTQQCARQHRAKLRIRHGELVVTHPNGTRTRAVMVKCGHCGKEFPKSVTAMKAGRRHACSRSCSGHVSRL
jgi:hypothetical protein